MPITLTLDPAAAKFYEKIAAGAGLSLSQVLSDVLFKLAGELALEAIQNQTHNANYPREIL